MYFQHSDDIWTDHPELIAGAVFATGIDRRASVGPQVTKFDAVAEALHGSAPADVPRLTSTIADELRATWQVAPSTAILSPSAPRFEF